MTLNELNLIREIIVYIVITSIHIQVCVSDPTLTKDNKAPLEFVYEFSHTDKDPERKLAYWREDPSLGVCHLAFHQTFTFWIPQAARDVVFYRSGELFYYFHQQIQSRYNSERFAMGLPKVLLYKDFSKPILEGYFPNYPPMTTKYNYYGRPANMTLADLPRGLRVSDFTLWRNRMVEAVQDGYILHHNGSKININNTEGVDLLADVSLSTVDSPNHEYYGCHHTYFHLIAGKITDPEEKYHNYFNPIKEFMLTMGDPLFYRYHGYVVDLFLEQKAKLPMYTPKELKWDDVSVKAISVIGDLTNITNQLTTYTQQWKPLMMHGFDFLSDVPVKVLFKILQHEEFTYTLTINNLANYNATATVRLFLAPVHDQNGNMISLQEQRLLFSEMDKFKIVLKPGEQTVKQHSTKSWVTVPLEKITESFASLPSIGDGLLDLTNNPCLWPRRYMNQSEGYIPELIPGEFDLPFTIKMARDPCGWPHHLLLPRGKKEGMTFALFAMLTNWQDDKVRSTPEQDFDNASAFCGIFNDTYPDKRPMGFPFDRPFAKDATLKSVLLSNMAATTIKIYHSDQLVPLNGSFNPSKK